MEIYFVATGPLHWIKQFENQLEAQSFAIPFITPHGELKQNFIGGLLEPINLYRMIVSEGATALLLRTLGIGKPSTAKNKFNGLPIFALRKILGLKGLPEDPAKDNWKSGPTLPVNTEHIQILPIGIKEDDIGMIATTGVVQEKI